MTCDTCKKISLVFIKHVITAHDVYRISNTTAFDFSRLFTSLVYSEEGDQKQKRKERKANGAKTGKGPTRGQRYGWIPG